MPVPATVGEWHLKLDDIMWVTKEINLICSLCSPLIRKEMKRSTVNCPRPKNWSLAGTHCDSWSHYKCPGLRYKASSDIWHTMMHQKVWLQFLRFTFRKVLVHSVLISRAPGGGIPYLMPFDDLCTFIYRAPLALEWFLEKHLLKYPPWWWRLERCIPPKTGLEFLFASCFHFRAIKNTDSKGTSETVSKIVAQSLLISRILVPTGECMRIGWTSILKVQIPE